MAKLRLDPRGANPYVESVMDLIGKMALADWEQKRKLDELNKVGQVLEAQDTIGGAATGGEMGPTPRYMEARGALEKLKPQYGGTAYLKRRDNDRTQAVVDPETGQILFTRPRGSVFQPKAKTTTPKLKLPTQSGMQSTAVIEGKGVVPVKPYFLKPRSERVEPTDEEFLAGIEKQFGEGKAQPKASPTKTKKSPYAEYPDAFQEGGVWKVIRNGKKYRIEE